MVALCLFSIHGSGKLSGDGSELNSREDVRPAFLSFWWLAAQSCSADIWSSGMKRWPPVLVVCFASGRDAAAATWPKFRSRLESVMATPETDLGVWRAGQPSATGRDRRTAPSPS